MIRLWLLRAALVALPFVAWYVWSSVARRLGRPVAPAPYAWLFVVGIALMASSVFATVLLRDDHKDDLYVPAEVRDGQVIPGRFEDR
jgi:hypothetical protein